MSFSSFPASLIPQADKFAAPNFEAPIDVAARIARVPRDATIKGLFFCDLVQEANRKNITLPCQRRYLHFNNYPMREWMALLAEAALRFHPNMSLGEALRRVGRRVYPAFSSTLIGRVLFSTVGSDFGTLLVLAGSAFRLADPKCTYRITHRHANSLIVELRDNWSFPETYNVGIFEGAAEAFRVQGVMRTNVLSENDMDVFVAWQQR